MRFHPLIQNSSCYFSWLKRVCHTQTLTSIEHHIISLHLYFCVQLRSGSVFPQPDKNMKFLRFLHHQYHNNWASEASPTLGCSIEISRDIYMYIYIYVCLSYVKSRGITWIKYAHAQSQYWVVKSDQWHPYYSFRLYARAALAWTEEKRSLRNEKLKANRAS